MTEALMYKTQTELELEQVVLIDDLCNDMSEHNQKQLYRLLEITKELTKRMGA